MQSVAEDVVLQCLLRLICLSTLQPGCLQDASTFSLTHRDLHFVIVQMAALANSC